ncbi:MAG: phosphate ABC transporter ATP-binding protein [Thermosphaera sp.]
MFAVDIQGLNVFINGSRILENVSIKVPYNTIHVIMGPSGSGKTTLLRVINRLIDLKPNTAVSGRVVVLGRDAFATDPYALRRSIGMVFQTPNPFPHLTIYDNVAIGARLNMVVKTKSELDEVVKWALEKAMLWDEVKNRLSDYPAELSGGQRQRLCLARALAMKPRLLLLDEPTANIDPVYARKLEKAILSLKDDVTIVMVTHSPHQAARIADDVTFIYEGRVVEQGPASKIFLHPSSPLTESFLRGEM